MTIRIGRPAAEEAETFAALHVRCWREAYRDYVPTELLANADSEQRSEIWRAALADADRVVLAAYNGDEAVGFIMADAPLEYLFDRMDGHVAALYVLRSHYRMGIGRRLLGGAAIHWAKTGGCSLALGVLAENQRVRHFYEAMGAGLVSTGTYEWDGQQLPDAIYVFENLDRLAAFV